MQIDTEGKNKNEILSVLLAKGGRMAYIDLHSAIKLKIPEEQHYRINDLLNEIKEDGYIDCIFSSNEWWIKSKGIDFYNAGGYCEEKSNQQGDTYTFNGHVIGSAVGNQASFSDNLVNLETIPIDVIDNNPHKAEQHITSNSEYPDGLWRKVTKLCNRKTIWAIIISILCGVVGNYIYNYLINRK